MKRCLLMLYVLLISLASDAAIGSKLAGLTQIGGTNGTGTLITYLGGDTALSNYFVMPAGGCPGCGSYPSGNLLRANDGKLYGLTFSDGANYLGTLFSYEPFSGVYTALANFNIIGSGYNPEGALMQASNGLLYGLTSGGAANGYGTLFSYRIGDDSVVKLIDLPAAQHLSRLNSLIQSSNHNLYGMSTYDGLSHGGTIFEYNIGSNTYTVKYNFTARGTPFGDLLQVGTDTLYGLTYSDGTHNNGTLFRFIPLTNAYTVLYNFDSIHGGHPASSLIRGVNGKLYGTTRLNGSLRYGTLFSFDLSTLIYTDLHNFSGGAGGAYPQGSPYQPRDGMIYGMTTGGGGSAYGTLYQYNIGTNVFTTELSFNFNNGASPLAGLIEYEGVPIINTQPSNQTGCIGGAVNFRVSVLDDTSAQWQQSIDGGITFSDIIGATDTIYSFTPSLAQNGYIYRVILKNIIGADTSNQATLSVYSPSSDTISASICPGQIYHVGSYSHSISGTYIDTIRSGNVQGCDSVVTLQLNVYYPATFGITATICDGTIYPLNSHSYNSTGIYSDTLFGASSHGCDSIVTLNLTVYSASSATVNPTICPGYSYTVGTHSHTTAGTYIDTVSGVSMHGCDSIVTTHLTIYPPARDTISVAICQGQSYMLGTQSYTAAGTYSYTYVGSASHGCDSTIVVRLSVNPAPRSTINATTCSGQSYTLGTHSYASAGTYQDTLSGASRSGCDSIITLHLRQYTAATYSMSALFCQGQNYVWGAYNLNTAGTYTDTLHGASVHGCDSIVTLILNYYPSSSNTITTTICQGDSFVVGTSVYTTAGNYFDVLPGASMYGCDSLVATSLSVTPYATSTVSATICGGQRYTIGTHSHTATGTYTDTLSGAAASGCDSLVTLHLTVHTLAMSSISATICAGSSYTLGTHHFSTNGIFTDTLHGAATTGCDSFVVLNLIVHSPVVFTTIVSSCQATGYSFYGHTYTQPGYYADTIVGSLGCDSVINVLHMVQTPMNDTATVTGAVCRVRSTGGSYQWMYCTTNQYINGAIYATYTASANGDYRCRVSLGTCVDTSNCVTVTGVGINEAADYHFHLYPNPTKGSFVVEQDYSPTVTLHLINMLGEKVRDWEMVGNQGFYVMSELPTGIYQLQVCDGDRVLRVMKVVKE